MARRYSALVSTLMLVALLCSSSHGKTRECEQGWKPFRNQCFKVIEEYLPWTEAWLNCKKHGADVSLLKIPDQSANELLWKALKGTEVGYWLNINSKVVYNPYSSTRSKLVWNNTGIDVARGYTNFHDKNVLGTFYGSQRMCGYMGTEGQWYKTTCTEKKGSLCTKDQGCEDGYYGSDCEKLCHCYQSGCDMNTGKCQYGCEVGWTGEKCDIKKVEAKASIYCFESSNEGKYIVIRLNPMNVTYQTISLVSEQDNTECNKTMFQKEKDGILSIRINMTFGTEYPTPRCPLHSSGNNVYTMSLKTEEKAGFHGYYDRLFELRCDFKIAETLQRNSNPKIMGEMHANPIKVNQSREDVELFIKNPVTSEKLSEVGIGNPIFLAMVLNKTDDKLSAKGISPHSCKLSSVDGTVIRKLIAENGCSEDNAPVSPFKGRNMTSLATSSFEAFTLYNHSVFVFSCDFQFCFDENEQLCSDRCSYMRRNYGYARRRWKRSVGSREKSDGSAAAYLRLIENDDING